MKHITARATYPLLRKTLLAASVAALLPGCGGGDNGPAPAAPQEPEPQRFSQQLRGEIQLVNPASDNTVKVISGSATVADATSFDNGSFRLETSPVTAEALAKLRIEAQVCSNQLDALTCAVLSAALVPNQLNAITQINIRSTLADRLARAKSLSQEEAEKRVSFYLMLDEGTTSQNAVSSARFSPARFVSDTMAAATTAGVSLDKQIDTLVASIAADPALQKKYPPLVGIAPLVTFVGMKLLEGAATKIGGEVAGQALSWLGLGSQAQDQQRHQEVMAGLAKLDNQLQAMSAQLSQIESGVNATLRKVDLVDRKVDDVLRRQRAQSLLTQTTALVEYVQTVKNTLQDVRNSHQLSLSAQVEERRRLKTVIEGLLSKRTTISAALSGDGGNTSMIATLVDLQFPEPVIQDFNKADFFGPATITSLKDFIQYYDNINVLAYYLFMEYYNSLEDAGSTGKPCPETLVSGTQYSRQCTLYHEIKDARTSYLQLGPQESLPVADMFIYVPPKNPTTGKPNMPSYLYPVGDFTSSYLGSTETPDAVVKRLNENLTTAEQRTELNSLANWQFLDRPAAWFGMFTNPAVRSGKSIRDTAVANGAPASAFVTSTGEAVVWVRYGTTWDPVNTLTSGSEGNRFGSGKFMVYGQAKSVVQLEKYMGKLIAARFK